MATTPQSRTPPGRWTWESARGRSRAIRVSPHPDEQLLAVSLWRNDRCVGSAHLAPAEVAALVGKLTDALAELARPPATDPPALVRRVAELETRLAALEEGTVVPLRPPAPFPPPGPHD